MRNNINTIGNPAQLRAIEHDEGPACVIAGPGSGKTFVIIKRIIRLIKKGVPSSSILVITFTKAAAIEMQQRFTKETDSLYPEVLFGTFHSIFYQILRISASKDRESVTIITEKQKYGFFNAFLSELRLSVQKKRKELIKQGAIDLPDEIEYTNETIKGLLSEVSRLKNDGLSAKEHDSDVPLSQYFNEIYSEYELFMKEQRLIDFDDMVLMCHDFLKENKEALRLWQDKFKYILIDEYQDINKMQFEVVRMLAGDRKNLFVVGDDDQSIYGFRGSRPELMLGFSDIFTGTKQIILDVNYRCAPKILENAVRVIDENKVRFKKNIVSGIRDVNGIVKGAKFIDKNDQYLQIIRKINSLLQEDSDLGYKDIAIIFRTNMEASMMARYLIKNKLPCTYREKVVSLYDKPHVRDVLSYLSFAFEGQKRSDFLRIMNQPLRYFSRECARNAVVRERDVIDYYLKKSRLNMAGTAQRFFKDIEMIRSLRPYLAISYVRNVIGFNSYINEKFIADKELRAQIFADLDELEKAVTEFRTYEELKAFLDEERQIAESMRKAPINEKKGVRVMTMHASKGLEFEVVFIPDLNEGVIPSRKSISESSIEEERRMLYVAMTRAKKKLYLSYVEGDKNNPMRKSGFLRPINCLFEE